MAVFVLKAAAKADLKRVARFTENRWGRDQRNRYLKQLDEAFHQLANNKQIGKRCDYIRSGYRKLPVVSHVIYYKVVDTDQIAIIRILHKNMDVSRALL